MTTHATPTERRPGTFLGERTAASGTAPARGRWRRFGRFVGLGLWLPLPLGACGAPATDGSVGADGPAVAGLGQLQQPIVGATTDATHTAVLAVATLLGRSETLCTGSLIAPNLVLTAQHCIADTAAVVDCETSAFADPYPARDVWVSTDGELGQSASFYPAREIRVPDAEGVCGNDIALIILAGQFSSAITPLDLRLDDAVGSGETYTAVGFGDALEEGHPGIRRSREGLAVTCGTALCRAPTRLADTEFIGDASVCEGDSGGPALDADGRVFGVVSRGAADCGIPIYSAVSAWGDWIREVTSRAVALGSYPAPGWLSAPDVPADTSASRLPSRALPGDPDAPTVEMPAVAEPAGQADLGLDPAADPTAAPAAAVHVAARSSASGCSMPRPGSRGSRGPLSIAVLLAAPVLLRRRRRPGGGGLRGLASANAGRAPGDAGPAPTRVSSVSTRSRCRR